MKCLNCNHTLPDDSDFCQYCGTKLNSISSNNTQETLSTADTNQAKAKRAKYIGVISLLALLLFVSLALNLSQINANAATVETIAMHEEKISNLERLISEQRTLINSIQKKADYYDTLCEELKTGNIGFVSKNFQASEHIIVVRTNERDRKFKLTANWSGGGTVSYECSSSAATVSFDKDSWSVSTPITIHPVREGVCVITFSSSETEETFKVLIVVTD